MSRRQEDLSQPRTRRMSFGIHYDPDAFGRFSESIARTFGTAKFLIVQTIVVAVWIVINVAWVALRWDKYPFILLNLAFSTQAAYAAPLILLAQNRQEARDREQLERDREVSFRTQQDAEYLARELASIRIALQDMVTTQDLEEQLEKLIEEVASRRDHRDAKSKPKKKKQLGFPAPPPSETDEDAVL